MSLETAVQAILEKGKAEASQLLEEARAERERTLSDVRAEATKALADVESRAPQEAERRRVVAQNRKRAAERAENAHDYGKRHWICRYCIQSRGADAYALGEGHASIFDKRIPRGFKR